MNRNTTESLETASSLHPSAKMDSESGAPQNEKVSTAPSSPRQDLQDCIDALVSREGSDIHFIVSAKPFFRVKRELVPFVQKSIVTEEYIETVLRHLAGTTYENPQKTVREKKHLLFSYQHTTENGRVVNFRITAYLQRNTIAIAMRLIQEMEKGIEELNLPPTLKSIMKEPSGLFLMVGPVGNGKSSALAAMLHHCNNTLRRHILTIEDPIEFSFRNQKSIISQREVPGDSPDFRTGLDSALRADADILMIGEMREIETMKTTMTAAEVGHLVLSTVHSNSAPDTVHRIIDSFPPEQQRQIANQLAASLLGVCSIRLLPRISGGLIPACEILLNTAAVANLIREGRVASIKTAIQTGMEEGMLSLEHSLADLVKRGEISLETAIPYAGEEQALMKYL